MRDTDVSVTMVQMSQRRGGALLKKWLKDERRSQEWLAEQIGNSQTNISQWINGPRPPPLDVAIAIEKVTSVEVHSWGEPADSGTDVTAPAKAS